MKHAPQPTTAPVLCPVGRSRRAWMARMLAGSTGLLAAGWGGVARADVVLDFFRAIRRDDGRSIRSLLLRGLDPNRPDEAGRIGLVFALQQDCVEAAEAILASPKVDVNGANAKGETPLMMASMRGHYELVRELIRRGAQVNRKGWTPLHYAAAGTTDRQSLIVAYLLEQHAYIDAESPNATTPLMMAAQYGTEAVVNLLLREGADARLRNQQGLTALDFARRSEREHIVERIVQGMRNQQPRRGQW